MAETKQTETKQTETKQATVKLRHPIAWTGELAVDRHSYPVKDGAVEVPVEHVPHAQQSGFLAE